MVKIKKIRPILGPSISGTKCDRDKLIFSAERGVQSDHDEALNMGSIRSKIPQSPWNLTTMFATLERAKSPLSLLSHDNLADLSLFGKKFKFHSVNYIIKYTSNHTSLVVWSEKLIWSIKTQTIDVDSTGKCYIG